eukprot:5450820-Prymnesium_polylepis.1
MQSIKPKVESRPLHDLMAEGANTDTEVAPLHLQADAECAVSDVCSALPPTSDCFRNTIAKVHMESEAHRVPEPH